MTIRHPELRCVQCGSDEWASLLGGVCDRCRGSARTQRAPTAWARVSLEASCDGCAWSEAGLDVTAAARQHHRDTGHAIQLAEGRTRTIR